MRCPAIADLIAWRRIHIRARAPGAAIAGKDQRPPTRDQRPPVVRIEEPEAALMTSTSTSSPELPARVRSDNAVAPAGAAWVMLALATLGFALNFWAWALLSPLGAHLKTSLSLSSFQQALIVAVPVIVGSLGRIPVGALTTLTQSDAAAKMAGFVLVAVALRPLGGYLSDRIGPTPILGAAFGVVTLGALVQAGGPALVPTATVAFLTMAAALGLASGAVFALVAQRAPGRQVGAVTGSSVRPADSVDSSHRCSWAASMTAATPTPAASSLSLSSRPPPPLWSS